MQPATTIVDLPRLGEASSGIEGGRWKESEVEASEMKRRSVKEITPLMTGVKAISNLSAL